MKSLFLIKSLIAIGFISMVDLGKVSVSNSENSTKCLEINGLALDENNQPLDSVMVTLFQKNNMDWKEVVAMPYQNKGFDLVVDMNNYYYMEVTKPGYLKRYVFVSTFLPEGVDNKPLFHYLFDMTLYKANGETTNELNYPIALIGYNPKNEVFDGTHQFCMPKSLLTKPVDISVAQASGN